LKVKKAARIWDLELIKKLSPLRFKPVFGSDSFSFTLIDGLVNPKIGTKMETVKERVDIVLRWISKSMLQKMLFRAA
jgi:hypothetical protein